MEGHRNLNIGGLDLKFDFIIDPDTGIHAWVTTVDELSLIVSSNLLYKTIEDHPLYCINKSISDPKDFAATMTFDNFKSMILSSEAGRFKDSIVALYDILTNGMHIKTNNMYVSFFSDSTPNIVNAMVEIDKGLISFGACMNGKGS